MMKKRAFFLMGDYWHPADTIAPLAPLLLPPETWDATVTQDPAALPAERPDLLVSLKDPVENNQIPTPPWCDAAWTDTVKAWVDDGMGFLAIHAALADLPREHPMARDLLLSVFVRHPAQCPVRFVPTDAHPVTEGVEAFTLPENDEHYHMDMLDAAGTRILGETRSAHGSQPGLWVHERGRGRICCVTPGHVTPNLTFPPYVRLLRNAVRWCVSQQQ